MKTSAVTTVRLPGGSVLTIDTRAAAEGCTHPAASDTAATDAVMRTTVQLPAELHMALRRRAINADTTMGKLVRAAIEAGLQAPAELAAESMPHRRVKARTRRTTVDLPSGLHRALKVLAGERDTTVQALILAAILRTYPTRR